MLEFGWPLGFDRKFEEFGNNKIAKNHSGARDFAKDIDKYIKKEVGYGAVLGPFASNPFKDHLVISPLNSMPKANSEERRVIMDLSFPKGKSVNDGIDKNVCLGKHVELHYPNVDNFIEIIKEKGEFCKIFKRDLRRAYRQIPVDPKDYNLIGFFWKGHYFVDRVLPMGLKSSAFIDKDTASLKEVQSLIGKLNFIASCVRPGRIFISRILNFLREFKNEDCVLEVSLELKHDLLWWSEFLEIYNGVSLLNLQEWTEPDKYMASDACLVGCGGVSNGQFFLCVFPDFIVQQNLHINALELLSVIVCLKLWGQKGRKICIQCDNMVSVQVINQGKSRSRFLQACLREICFICAIKECELRAIHIDGIDNRLPDMLSRWSLSDIYPIQFYKSIEGRNFSLSVDLHMLRTQAQESLRSAHASGTRKNLKIQWKAFFLFCHFYNLKTLPCELNTLYLFAQFLSRSFKSVDSIRNYLNGVKVLHLLFDLPFIHFESFYFSLFMKGLKRCNPHTVRAALPITPSLKAWGKPSIVISDSILKYLPEMRNTQLQAFGGLSCELLLRKLKNRVFTWYHFNNIIVHVGTNDLFNINTNVFEKYIRDIIHELRICNPDCVIILSSILPRPCDFNHSELFVINFNNVLKQLSSSLTNVRYMASEKTFYNRVRKPINTLFSIDKLHLSTTGLNKVFSFIANTLEHL
ncbi:unnamed protein product [Mytilus coruscus]|uniref:Reverse transcriptase domain-containing protein n=1 Tax=Mytilus coruscus TaxID=42192 RepID=A0A6J8EQ70_MYTCO|nr:unnamed protein product [Mytilus coruscus]